MGNVKSFLGLSDPVPSAGPRGTQSCEDLVKSADEGWTRSRSSQSTLQAQGSVNDRLPSRRNSEINQGFQDPGFRDHGTRISSTTGASYVNSSSSRTTSVAPRLPLQGAQLPQGTSNTLSKDASGPVTSIFLIYETQRAKGVMIRLRSGDAAASLSSLKSLERFARKNLPVVDTLLSQGSRILQLKGAQARIILNAEGLRKLSLVRQSVPLVSDNDLSSLVAGSQKECGVKEDTYLSFWVEVKDQDIISSCKPAPPPPTTSILASQKKSSEELKYPPYSKQHPSDVSTDSRSRAVPSKPYTAAPAPRVPAGQQRPSQRETGAAIAVPSRRAQDKSELVCHKFLSGLCKLGSTCSLSHNPEARIPRPEVTAMLINNVQQWRNELCWNLLLGCRNLTCRYSHDIEMSSSSATNYNNSSYGAPSFPGDSPLFSPREIEDWLWLELQLDSADNIEQLGSDKGLQTLSKVADQMVRFRLDSTIYLLVKLLAKDDLRSSMMRQKTDKIYGVVLGSQLPGYLASHIVSQFGSGTPYCTGAQDVRLHVLLIQELVYRTVDGHGWKEAPLLRTMINVVSNMDHTQAKSELVEIMTRLYDHCGEQLQQNTSSPRKGLPGQADFRKMSIIPQKEELLISVQKKLSSLPINKVGQRHRYSSVTEYLETHFQLLREDYVHSLRQGIRAHGSNKAAAVNDSTSGLIFYSPVQLVDLLCGQKGVEYSVSFCIESPDQKQRTILWESSKLLMSGTLLCISADDFQTFFWGVVGLRDVRELSHGRVSIQILDVNPGRPENHKFQAGKVYTMVESSEAYFEPYSHVLASLQSEEMNNLPFSQYLVQLETKVGPPSYMLGRHKRDEYILSSAFPDIVQKLGRSSINVMQEWPNWEHSLDKAQIDALKLGLTKELAIIQGPPGTGKSFLTLLLVKILLANLYSKSLARSEFTSDFAKRIAAATRSVPEERRGNSEEEDCEKLRVPPILIVCHTNHALDQLLEGVYQTEKDMIRIGGGSKSNMLQERTLGKLLKEQRANIEGSLQREYFRASVPKDILKHRIMACKGAAIGTPIEHMVAGHHQKLEDLCPEYESSCKALSEVEDEIEVSVLRTAKVIGMTTSGAVKHQHTLKSLRPEIIIVEEAAEVLESHILACLTPSVKHLILVGDPLQQRPKTAVHELAENHKLDVSMFERLVASGVDHVTLQIQRRMRPCISNLAKSVYPHFKDHHSVTLYPDVKGLLHNLFFFDHRAAETAGGDPGSMVNVKEARLVVELSLYLQNQGCYAAKDITVLTAYSAQVAEIRKHLRERCGVKVDASSENDDEGDLELFPRIRSIDNYQGEECEIIILSLVRNRAISNRGRANVEFLSVMNRMCVGLMRARKGLYIFGNATLLAEKSNLWKDVIKGMQESGSMGPHLTLRCENHPEKTTKISKPEHFKQVKDGGCTNACKYQLRCGHACPRSCHHGPHDSNVVCGKPCSRKFQLCKHRCSQICHGASDCPPCTEMVPKQCGHAQQLTCSDAVKGKFCTSKCSKVLKCGHQCKNMCGYPCTALCTEMIKKQIVLCGHSVELPCHQKPDSYLCKKPCNSTLEGCGHTCKGNCGSCDQGKAHILCEEKCTRILPCGHVCQAGCSVFCPPCQRECEKKCCHGKCELPCRISCRPCMKPCASRCEHFTCDKLCHEMCTRPRCNQPCSKLLPGCGHACIGLCGDPCPTKCRVCDPDTQDGIWLTSFAESSPSDRFVQLVDCGHVFEVGGLDTFLDDEPPKPDSRGSTPIALKMCPTCRTPIWQSHRYSNVVKKAHAQVDIVKRRIVGYDHIKLGHFYLETGNHISGISLFNKALEADRGLLEAHFGIACGLFSVKNYPMAIAHLAFLVERSSFAVELAKVVKRAPGTAKILKSLRASTSTRSDDMLARKAIVQWASALTHLRDFSTAIELCDCVLRSDPADSLNAKELKHHAQKGEVQLVVQAMAKDVGRKGQWYECPNGHVYSVGECGRTMEKSNCPDCQAQVGGRAHQLLKGNRPANIDTSSSRARSNAKQ